jgi:hypothetical protein
MTSLTIKNDNLPAHLQDNFGIEATKDYISPLRIKTVQALSKKLTDLGFEEGDLVAVPLNIMLAPVEKVEGRGGKEKRGDAGKPFFFVPLLFWAEYCLWNPRETSGTLDMIRERTYDNESELARKAKDPKKRGSMICPEMPQKDGKPLYCKYVEHLNFIILLQGMPEHELNSVPLLLSFSSGEHNQGRQLCQLMKLRNAPICGCRYMGQSRLRERNDNAWFGIDVNNPMADTVKPFVDDPEEFAVYKAMHLELKEAHEQDRLRADYSDDSEEDAAQTTEY